MRGKRAGEVSAAGLEVASREAVDRDLEAGAEAVVAAPAAVEPDQEEKERAVAGRGQADLEAAALAGVEPAQEAVEQRALVAREAAQAPVAADLEVAEAEQAPVVRGAGRGAAALAEVAALEGLEAARV